MEREREAKENYEFFLLLKFCPFLSSFCISFSFFFFFFFFFFNPCLLPRQRRSKRARPQTAPARPPRRPGPPRRRLWPFAGSAAAASGGERAAGGLAALALALAFPPSRPADPVLDDPRAVRAEPRQGRGRRPRARGGAGPPPRLPRQLARRVPPAEPVRLGRELGDPALADAEDADPGQRRVRLRRVPLCQRVQEPPPVGDDGRCGDVEGHERVGRGEEVEEPGRAVEGVVVRGGGSGGGGGGGGGKGVGGGGGACPVAASAAAGAARAVSKPRQQPRQRVVRGGSPGVPRAVERAPELRVGLGDDQRAAGRTPRAPRRASAG